MIIDGPNTLDLALGTDRRILEAGDSQLSLPPSLIPVLLNLRPHVPTPTVATLVFQGSAILRGTEVANAPSTGQTATNLLMLDKGLWEIEATMSSWFDYGGTAPAILGALLRISYQAVTCNLLHRFAAVGAFVDYQRVRLLLTQSAQISMVNGATGVGQNNALSVTMNAIKVL